jgi:hypothetical protein
VRCLDQTRQRNNNRKKVSSEMASDHRNLRTRTRMLAQALKIFWGKEHLVKISTQDKVIYFRGLQSLSSLHKIGWRSAEKISPFFQTCFFLRSAYVGFLCIWRRIVFASILLCILMQPISRSTCLNVSMRNLQDFNRDQCFQGPKSLL